MNRVKVILSNSIGPLDTRICNEEDIGEVVIDLLDDCGGLTPGDSIRVVKLDAKGPFDD